ncbi:MAG TPA: glycosyltransferase family 4 protein [Gemmatimonadaceae bacterium]|nr:glycosyltransferase family 4 protein [Gemmatimonadaceae bacterium]
MTAVRYDPTGDARTILAPASAHFRLLWVNHFAVAPSDGGGTRHFDLAHGLRPHGWHVTIAASDFHLHSRGYTRRTAPEENSAIAERVDDVDFLWLYAPPYKRNDWRRARNWLSFSRSLGRLSPNATRPDVIIGSSPHLFAAHAAYRMARRLCVPFVLEIRDLWPESIVAAGGRRGPAYHTLGALAKHLYARADRIIILARGTGDHLAARGVDCRKMVYVPNGADPAPNPHPWPAPDAPFTLVYAGAHGPANGLDTVLDAAALVKDRPIRILLVGDGPAKAALAARAAREQLPNVEFRDPVPKTAMPDLLASAHAGLMVLRDAPLFAFGVSPNKLFDYLAAGLPVVCNVPGEVAGMLRDAAAGEQAADSSARALADAIVRLAKRPPDTLRTMGDAARDWISREHSRPVLAQRLDAALRPLVAT